MSKKLTVSYRTHIRNRRIVIPATVLLAVAQAVAQNPELQQKVADVKQAAAANKQRLLQYQWTETTQITLNGDAKPPSQKLCRYGPDGQVQKTPIGPPPPPPSGGRVKQRVIAKKKAEITDYMDDVKNLWPSTCRPTPREYSRHSRPGKYP